MRKTTFHVQAFNGSGWFNWGIESTVKSEAIKQRDFERAQSKKQESFTRNYKFRVIRRTIIEEVVR